ncbi:MAG: hypothetical protein M3P24_06345, partial [Gemmatimonadota bacterium]|nr:hypothetical protein [Gemmatimonadota bacterium]
LIDPAYGSPHTVGRVWSPERQEWLYFDIFWGGVVVFRQLPGGGLEFLAREGVPPDRPGEPQLRELYALVEHGQTLNEYRSTFLGYLGFKLKQAVARRSLASLGPAPATAAAGRITPGAGPDAWVALPPGAGAAGKWKEEDYLEARLEHLLGDPASARRLYSDLASRGAEAGTAEHRVLQRASYLFSRGSSD